MWFRRNYIVISSVLEEPAHKSAHSIGAPYQLEQPLHRLGLLWS